MKWITYLVDSMSVLALVSSLMVIFLIGFLAGSIITQRKLHGIGALCITKEGDAYLQLPDEKTLDELKSKDFALLSVIREDSAKNAPTIME